VIVTEVPATPLAGETELTTADAATVNCTPLLVRVPTVTVTAPLLAPAGTETVILVSAQLVAVAETPLNNTCELPCVAPKPLPASVTEDPITPVAGVRLLSVGVEVTVNDIVELLAVPFVVTRTVPVVADFGTEATIFVSLQLATEASTLLNETVLVP